ncbi:MAG: Dam family site-specific DNA-(adenine-N6)-methyltransferase [Patescibacteria group bacterium]
MIYPFKWAGNKKKLLSVIQEIYKTSNCNKIIEPFCGSAVFSLNTEAKSYEISDINIDLIDLWLNLKNNWLQIFEFISEINIQKIKEDQQSYILLRENYNKCNKGYIKSALLFVLLGCCTNNLGRWNGSGEFNQTWGSRKAEVLKYLTEELRLKITQENFKIFRRNYNEIISEENTFTYFDPPYLLSNDCYQAKQWDEMEEQKFLNWVKTIKGKWAISNIISKNGKINKYLEEFSKDYNLINLDKKYNAKVGGYKEGIKNESQEVLITNFEFNNEVIIKSQPTFTAKDFIEDNKETKSYYSE